MQNALKETYRKKAEELLSILTPDKKISFEEIQRILHASEQDINELVGFINAQISIFSDKIEIIWEENEGVAHKKYLKREKSR